MTHENHPPFSGDPQVAMAYGLADVALSWLPIPVDFTEALRRGDAMNLLGKIASLRTLVNDQPITDGLRELLLDFLTGLETMMVLVINVNVVELAIQASKVPPIPYAEESAERAINWVLDHLGTLAGHISMEFDNITNSGGGLEA